MYKRPTFELHVHVKETYIYATAILRRDLTAVKGVKKRPIYIYAK